MRKWTGRRDSFGCIIATLLTPSIILRRRRKRTLGAVFTAIATFGIRFRFRYVVECYTASAVVPRSMNMQKWEAEGSTQ